MKQEYFKAHFLVVPLSWDNLDRAIAAVNRVLPHHRSALSGPESSYRIHLGDPSYRGAGRQRRIARSGYHLLVCRATRNIVGVAGYYVKYGAAESATTWLDWFGIVPEYRGSGLGTRLFKWMESRAVRDGSTTLKFFTSSRKSESGAQRIYEALNYPVVRTYAKRDRPHLLYLRTKEVNR